MTPKQRPAGEATVEQPPQFSLTGAGVTLVGQAVVLPADWHPAFRAAVAFGCSVAVGVLAPMLRDLARQAVVEVIGRKRAEAERDAARQELAESLAEVERLRSGKALLGPPPPMHNMHN